MITLEDCIAMCGLTEEEVLAIAEHELCQDHGAERIRDMLKGDIRAALARNDREHARELFMALRDFLSMHPEGARTLNYPAS